jgi:hypothetical protein
VEGIRDIRVSCGCFVSLVSLDSSTVFIFLPPAVQFDERERSKERDVSVEMKKQMWIWRYVIPPPAVIVKTFSVFPCHETTRSILRLGLLVRPFLYIADVTVR